MIATCRAQPAECRKPEICASAVAAVLADAIVGRMPELGVEHIGSSAVPGCAGKGVIDLMVGYPPGRLEPAKAVLAGLGFQPQSMRDPFPEDRPMRVGAIDYQGTLFRIHAHVLAAGCDEARETIAFRDLLRARPDLVDAYVARDPGGGGHRFRRLLDSKRSDGVCDSEG